MSHKAVIFVALMVFVTATTTNAALIAHWKLNDGLDGTIDEDDVAIDETGNYNGAYQATFFGATPTAATGIDGVTNTAVDFGAKAPPMLAVYPPDPNNPSSTGGIAVEHKNFTIEHWIRFNANPGHGTTLWGSNAPGAIGPLHEASFGMEAGELKLMWRLIH